MQDVVTPLDLLHVQVATPRQVRATGALLLLDDLGIPFDVIDVLNVREGRAHRAPYE